MKHRKNSFCTYLEETHCQCACLTYPQGDLHLEGAVGSRVLQRETLVQSHVLSLQQAAQRQRQRPQRAFVLLVLHLKLARSFFSQPVKNNREQLFKNRQDISVPRPPALGFWGCELRNYEFPPKLVHWSYTWSESVKGKNRNHMDQMLPQIPTANKKPIHTQHLVLTKSPKLLRSWQPEATF